MANTDPIDDLVITINPEATPEEVDGFLKDLARVILAIARRRVALEETPPGGEVIDF